MTLNADELFHLVELRRKGVSYLKCLEYFPGQTTDGLRSAYWRYNQQNSNDWVREEKLAFLDIEASGLDANFGYMLSWVLKPRGEDPIFDIITKKEIMNGTDVLDKRIVRSLLKKLDGVDIVCGYYSTRYDIPYIRTRAMVHGLQFPHYGTLKHYDLYYTVRNKLKLHRNRQEVACDVLGIQGKDHVEMGTWQKAKLGDADALLEVLDHNVRDVVTLEQLFEKMRPHSRIMRKSV